MELVSKVTSGTFVNAFYAMKCKNTNGEILRRVHRQHCKNYRFVARTSGEQQYDDDGATIDTRVQLRTLFDCTFFCCAWGNCCSNTKSMSKVVRQWVQDFRARRDEVHNLLQEGRLKDSLTSDAIAGIRSLLEEDRRLAIRQIEYATHKEMCNPILRVTVHRIVRDELAMKKVSSWWVPKQLTDAPK